MIASTILGMIAAVATAADRTPWTHLNFQNDPEDSVLPSFLIVLAEIFAARSRMH